jgi:hypothetical protein
MEMFDDEYENIKDMFDETVIYNDPLEELVNQDDEYAFIEWLKIGEDIMGEKEYQNSLDKVKEKLVKYEKFEWIKFLK